MKLFIVVICLTAIFFSASQRCGRNMQYSQCGSPCERTCHDVVHGRPPPTACRGGCSPPGCYCRPGFVRFYRGYGCVTEPACLFAKKK
uniref:TIL domain-containing protein n=1 Tax=Romanomermis culicivorax TaxID=13658 RepID=A0A915JTA2_ROMCU